ncbi:MAG: GTP-binding protein [Promethearchaeota archaeon]
MKTKFKQKIHDITFPKHNPKIKMVIRKEENILILLRNFIESQEDVEIAFVYSREGLLMAKYGRAELQHDMTHQELDEVHGAITSLVEGLFQKMSKEYKIAHFGSGSFETQDHRIIFLEAGPDAILMCVCDYQANLNKLFPYAYLVVEKIAQLLEESFDFKFNSLEIPDLRVYESFSLELDQYKKESKKPIYDGIYLKHHIKKVEKRQKIFKLIILGSAEVGKTTLVNSFLKKEQISDYRPTLGISISTQRYYIQGFRDDIISFLVYDLAGQEFFKRVRHDYYTGSNCAFIVYDITRRETFDEGVDFWFKDAKRTLGNIPFVLIGNKIDLDAERQVSREEGIKKAEELRTFFIETSALHNINVQDTFKLIGIGLFFRSLEDTDFDDDDVDDDFDDDDDNDNEEIIQVD